MTDEECQWYYDQLVVILEREGIVWLVEEVEEQISQGKIQVINDVETFKIRDQRKHKTLWLDADEQQDMIQFERGRRRSYLSPSDYSLSEQLHLLIETVRTYAEDQINIEERVLRFFQRDLDVETVEVYSEEFHNIATFRLSTIEIRRKHAEDLLKQLEILDKELNGDRS